MDFEQSRIGVLRKSCGCSGCLGLADLEILRCSVLLDGVEGMNLRIGISMLLKLLEGTAGVDQLRVQVLGAAFGVSTSCVAAELELFEIVVPRNCRCSTWLCIWIPCCVDYYADEEFSSFRLIDFWEFGDFV
ncbi:hypothetical protein Droror1_Dr00020506 [Drosera rotundifolia]